MSHLLAETLQLLGLMGLFAFFLWLLSRRAFTRSDLLRLHLEGRHRLLDRFASSTEFLNFARSEEGHDLLRPPQLPSPRPPAPAGLRLIQAGILCFLVSKAFVEVSPFWLNWRAANLHFDPFQEWTSWNAAVHAGFWGATFKYVGEALFLGGLLSAGLAWLDRRLERGRGQA